MEYYEYCDVIRNKITVLQQEVDVLRSKLEEYDTGHVHAAISVMQHRIAKLTEEFNEEQKQRNK